jgi:hypothetical protein
MALIATRAPQTGMDRTRALNRALGASALLLAPSIAMYALLALFLGTGPIVAGMSAYGEASSVCPWWPNGFSAVLGAAAICAAIAGVAVAEPWIAKPRSASEGSPRSAPWPWAIAGASVWLLYTMVFFRQLVASEGQSYQSGALAIASFLASTVTFAIPLMWAWWLMFSLELVDWLGSKGDRDIDAQVSLVMLGLLSGGSVRGLFGAPGTSSTHPPEAIQGLVFPFLPFLLSRMFHHWAKFRGLALSPRAAARIQVLACVVLCLAALVRIAAMRVKHEHKQYIAINTDAGPVKVADRDSADLYAFMKANTRPDEPIADLAYGGGVNFALHRPTPLYSTVFVAFLPTPQHRARDASQLAAARTRFVIKGNRRPAVYGAGAGCSFPRLTWIAPPCPGCDQVVFPVIQVIDQQYSSVAHFGDRDVYSLRAELNSASSMPAPGASSSSTANRY